MAASNARLNVKLENQTPFATRILQMERDEGRVQAVLIVKATFELGSGAARAGRWTSATEQVPIVDDKLDTPFGVFHTDCFTRKEGVDVCVLGTVRPPRALREITLRLDVAGYSSTLRVLGDRRWMRAGNELSASSPLPFAEMPLGYSHAYGGIAEHDYESITWPDNPIGRGYYLSADRAQAQLLPNIEPAMGPLVRHWADQPPTAGWAPYPMFWGMRAREGVIPPKNPESGEMASLKPRLNNNAHPSLIVADLSPGSVVRIRGMRSEDIVFELPHLSLVAEIKAGRQTTAELQGQIDGAYIWTDAGRITLTQRIPFSYVHQKGEVRLARLAERGS